MDRRPHPGGLLRAAPADEDAVLHFEDLVAAGVIDPMKVTRVALENAASVATLLLTSEALIAEKPKDVATRTGHADYDY